MSHHHDHKHPELSGKNLKISIFLNILITISQVIGGLISGSLALLSDALHNFTDVVSLIISFWANKMASKSASFSKTFGYKRAEIIAAFVNAASLMVISVLLIKESIDRFINPQSIDSTIVIVLAAVAILGNGFSVLLMKKDSKANMNMKSAYLHLLTDMLASVAVLLGGLLMRFYGFYWIDSLLTAGIAVYLIVMGYDLLKSSFNILMLFTPESIRTEELVKTACSFPEIKNMHHVHIWSLNETEIHLEAHLDFHHDISLSSFNEILEELKVLLNQKYGINHFNLQPEFNKNDTKEIIVQD